MDDVFNNGETFRQILKALTKHNLSLTEFRVMVSRNPKLAETL